MAHPFDFVGVLYLLILEPWVPHSRALFARVGLEDALELGLWMFLANCYLRLPDQLPSTDPFNEPLNHAYYQRNSYLGYMSQRAQERHKIRFFLRGEDHAEASFIEADDIQQRLSGAVVEVRSARR